MGGDDAHSSGDHDDFVISARLLRKIAALEKATQAARPRNATTNPATHKPAHKHTPAIDAHFPLRRKPGRPPKVKPAARPDAVDGVALGVTAQQLVQPPSPGRSGEEESFVVDNKMVMAENMQSAATVTSYDAPASVSMPFTVAVEGLGAEPANGDHEPPSPRSYHLEEQSPVATTARQLLDNDVMCVPTQIAGDRDHGLDMSGRTSAEQKPVPRTFGPGRHVRICQGNDQWLHATVLQIETFRLLVHYHDEIPTSQMWVEYDPVRVRGVNKTKGPEAARLLQERLYFQPSTATLPPLPSSPQTPPTPPTPPTPSSPQTPRTTTSSIESSAHGTGSTSDVRPFITRSLLRQLVVPPHLENNVSSASSKLRTGHTPCDYLPARKPNGNNSNSNHDSVTNSRIINSDSDNDSDSDEDEDAEEENGDEDEGDYGEDEVESDNASLTESDAETTSPVPRHAMTSSSSSRFKRDSKFISQTFFRKRRHRLHQKGRPSAKQLRKQMRFERLQFEEELRRQQQEHLDASAWFRCDNCQHGIHNVRYSCQYCETSETSLNTYDLCTACFQINFPLSHPHPRESFAMEVIHEDFFAEDDGMTKDHAPKPDRFLPEWESLNPPQSELELMMHQQRRETVCELCDEPEGLLYGSFVSQTPFAQSLSRGSNVSYFWIHRACALASAEVLCLDDDTWFNVAVAVRRGRCIKCSACAKKGATIGCMDIRCNKSFHVRCSGRPPESFIGGIPYWCSQHDATLTKDAYKYIINCDGCGEELRDSWRSCTSCESYWNGFDLCMDCFDELQYGPMLKRAKAIEDVMPAPDAASPRAEANMDVSASTPMSVDSGVAVEIAPESASESKKRLLMRKPICHPHGPDAFRVTHEKDFAAEALQQRQQEQLDGIILAKRRRPRRRKSAGGAPDMHELTLQCHYCSREDSTEWRRGFHGVVLCDQCADASMRAVNTLEDDGNSMPGPTLTTDESFSGKEVSTSDETTDGAVCDDYVAAVEDYVHQPYLTRALLTSTQQHEPTAAATRPLYLPTYAPQQEQLFSLGIKTTFFDVPGRAPRWASHSSSDYNGTWLPQIVRWTLERHTNEGDRVLSNFLGRGTDVIESFLLGRKAVGIDVNATAVALSQRNCTFAVPPELQTVMRADRRPHIVMGNAMRLHGPNFGRASFDHVLSHPPYFRCIVYSPHLADDISRSPDFATFAMQIRQVAKETRRVLKPGKWCTLGIGDNREHCFVVPVSFVTIEQYILAGFQLDELIVKRQRCCSGTAKGASLSMLHDFLIITHEFIAILRNPLTTKPDDSSTCSCAFEPGHALAALLPTLLADGALKVSTTISTIPAWSFAARCKVLGTVWCFPSNTDAQLVDHACAQVVGRFGSPGEKWERVQWADNYSSPGSDSHETSKSNEPDKKMACDDTDHGKAQINSWEEDSTLVCEEKETLTEYELEKNRRIERNNRLLCALGLLSTDDSMAGSMTAQLALGDRAEELLDRLSNIPPVPAIIGSSPAGSTATSQLADRPPTCLAFIDPKQLAAKSEIEPWRSVVLSECLRTARALCLGGVLVVGARDHRFGCDSCGSSVLWPLSMLLWKSLDGPLATIGLALKEIVTAVPKKYSKSKNDAYVTVTSQVGCSPAQVEHLPIVHDTYLIYVRKTLAQPLDPQASSTISR